MRHEFKVYRELQGCTGIGRVMYFGTYRDCNVMVMELLGPSLEDLFNQCGRRFSLKTTLQLADQLLERAETLHENHLIHRDIKPANFVVSPGDTAAMVFCIDFGIVETLSTSSYVTTYPVSRGSVADGDASICLGREPPGRRDVSQGRLGVDRLYPGLLLAW